MKISINHSLFNIKPAGILSCFTLFILLTLGTMRAEAQLFVDADATGLNDGSSWANAYVNLQDALNVATHGEGIFVAEGIYKPITPADLGNVTTTEREATFQLTTGIEVYGGFDPGDGDDTFGERDWEANPTILSGDIDDNDTTTDGVVTDTNNISGDNSYHVVTSSGNDDTTILDGFIITAGLANTGTLPNNVGGGLYILGGGNPTLENLTFIGNRAETGSGGMDNLGSDPILTNVTFENNSSGNVGGGMRNRSGASPVLNGVLFYGNSSDSEGGGMSNDDSSPKLTDVVFINNYTDGQGGGMYNEDSNPALVNVVFSGNTAAQWGGGMHNDNSSPTLVNVTFTGNTSNRSGDQGGGGMRNRNSSNPVLTNVIIWNNEANATSSESLFNDGGSVPVISHSIIEHSGGSDNWDSDYGTDGDNNLDTNPLFVDASDPDGADNEFFTDDDGLTLQIGSPAINAGTNGPFGSGEDADGVTTDLAGNDRIYDNGTVDMGAYEFQGDGVISGTASVEITGVAGWRMMGAPVTGVTVEDLSEMNLVQGIPGLPQEIGEGNFYFWDYDESSPDYPDYNGSFVPPANGSTELTPGTGFIWYMWGPEANPTLPESKTFPLTVELTGDEAAGDISLGTLPANVHLIANPFISDINFDEITDGDGNLLGVTGQVWDSNIENSGSYVNSYRLTTSASMNDKLSAWQGAFIELTSETEVIIPQSAKTTGANFYKEKPLAGQVEFQLEGFGDGDKVQTRDLAAILYFHEEATTVWDGYDVTKLTPLSETWATLNFIGNKNGEPVLKAQHALPYNYVDSEEIPVRIELQNVSGEFRLSWLVVKGLPSVDLWLLDRQTGRRYDLTRPGEIEFNMQISNKEDTPSDTEAALKIPEIKPMKFKTAEARFAILINPEDSGYAELPTEIALNQNYPNPFNPTTVISYQLPERSEVRLEVYDMLGRNVATLVDDQISAGNHSINFDGSALSSGVYMYRLQANNNILTKKLTLIK